MDQPGFPQFTDSLFFLLTQEEKSLNISIASEFR